MTADCKSEYARLENEPLAEERAHDVSDAICILLYGLAKKRLAQQKEAAAKHSPPRAIVPVLPTSAASLPQFFKQFAYVKGLPSGDACRGSAPVEQTNAWQQQQQQRQTPKPRASTDNPPPVQSQQEQWEEQRPAECQQQAIKAKVSVDESPSCRRRQQFLGTLTKD
jgi:hypothetical protein